MFAVFIAILTLLLPSLLFAAPQMVDYCYLPPFVTDPNTTPNIMIVYERGPTVTKRAYSTTYNSNNAYYGFFDNSKSPEAKYVYDATNNYFYKPASACTISRSNNCFSGNMLNWALMSSLDVSRKALVGFGWPDPGGGSSPTAGTVFTYSGNFCSAWNAAGTTCTNANKDPISYGQWEDGNSLRVEYTDTTNNFTYSFCLSKSSGGNPTKITIRAKDGSSAPSCTGSCTAAGNCTELVNNEDLAVKFHKVCSNDSTKVCTLSSECSSGGTCQEEVRYGIIQKYADKNQDYVYDSDGPRFGIRRWSTSTDKQADIMCDNATTGNCSSTDRSTLLKNILNVISKSPSSGLGDPTPYLGKMMEDIIDYFSEDYSDSLAYSDGSGGDGATTQSPYKWSTDPAMTCRKTFTIFMTSGAELGETSDKISGKAGVTMPSACTSLTYSDGSSVTDAFPINTCYAYNKDLSTATDRTQNIRTYVVHTTFLTDATNVDKLTYAARTVGGGEYISVSDPATLATSLEEAILNILSTSASASTVATLTTQTRESSTLTQAYFYPKREGTALKWIGYIRLLWSDSGANLREDTKNTGWLDLKKDNILSFFYDSTAVAYMARTYADADGDLKIDSASCTATDTKSNDNVLAIWNAQSKLLARTTDDRTIRVGIGNTSGVVTGSDCTTTSGYGCYNFTTSLASTFNSYWSYSNYCYSSTSTHYYRTTDTTRWCGGSTQTAANNSCNYCETNKTRTCANRTDAECYYCSGNTALNCPTVGATTNCVFDYSPCGTVTAGKCDGDATRTCTDSTITGGCFDDYGTCTTDTCNKYDVSPTFECKVDCDSADCATSVIKYVRGFDNPSGSTTTSGPGGTYRVRHKCPASGTAAASSDPDDSDCPAGTTCSGGECKRTCSSASDCFSGETCTSSKCESGADLTNTLKLGDIVYSTPRISPNSAVNGYDVTYTDTTYRDFIDKKIKGNCSADIDCPSSETCSAEGICSGDGYTPIVIVGANDGMVHAFKVSKIKDLSPAENNCYDVVTGTNSCGDPSPAVTDGSQTARFADYPHSVKTDANPSGSDTTPPTDIGKEMWAYIPFNAVPYLRWYCSKSYCHIPMVDARFTIVDASIDYDQDGVISATESRLYSDKKCESSGSYSCPNSSSGNYPWRRLLIGAMGAGGKQITVGSNIWSSSIFVLDITNSSSPTLLWERPLPDGTLTTSTPAVVRLVNSDGTNQSDKNGNWYLVIGSGPTAIGTNSVTYKSGNANIYVFDLRTGDLSATISTGASGVAVGDMMAVDIDSDYQVDDIYFGTYGGTGASQTGKFYRLRIRADTNATTKVYQTTPSDWDIGTVVDVGRPIYASPEIAQDSSGNIWLYFGTGLYLSGEHATATTDNEYLYGVKESSDCWKGNQAGSCSAYTTFLDSTNISFQNALATELGCFCAGNLMSTISCSVAGTCSSCGAGLSQVVTKVTNATLTDGGNVTACDNTADTAAIACLEAEIASKDGWKRTISANKMFSKPFVAGGLVDFTSFQPTSTSCSLGGSTYLWSLHYTTGTAYVQPTIFACDASGCNTSTSNLTINASVNLGTGVPPLGESLVALPLAGDTFKVITQVSGGLPGTSMAPSLPAKSGYVLWIVK